MSRPPLDAARWSRLQDLFHDVVETPPEARAALLERVAAEDPHLKDELISLLGAHEEGGLLGSLDRPAGPPVARIGPYRLGEMIGVGGMGVVYQAEREGADYTQRVALKLIRAGYADPRLEERLRRERRILARLEHPGIARFIDGGTTETGQSFFAMEYVAGTSLLDYARDHGLGIRERVRLFLGICDALHYAHQQLVVHGDLKPGNIMVTPAGHPKLLDFGIAELMDVTDGVERVTRSTPWLTPAYASPEQVRGERLTTLADVYSLGVVLYELLTGKLPYAIETRSPAEVERIVSTVEPARPSAVVDDPHLRRDLAGDLDTIILTALAKEPARRYASAEQLAADLERHLDGQPVLARPASASYRMGKFVRRHKAAALAAVAVFLSLVGGIAAVAWQARVASRERDLAEGARREAEAVNGFLLALFESTEPGNSGIDTSATRAFLTQGLTQVATLQGEPALQARVLEALGRMYSSLSDYAGALAAHQRALSLRLARTGERDPDVASSYQEIAMVLREAGRIPEADSTIALALRIERATLPPAHPQLARTLLAATNIVYAAGRYEEAERHAREALAITRDAEPPQDLLAARSIRILASVVRREGRMEESGRLYQEHLDFSRRRFGPDHPQTAAAMVHLGDFYRLVSLRPAAAESLYRAAIYLLDRAYGKDNPQLVHVRGSLSQLLASRGEFAAAESLQRANLDMRIRTTGRESNSATEEMVKLSALLRQAGRTADAAALAEEILAINRKRDAGTLEMAMSLNTLALARLAQGRGTEALELAEEGLALHRTAYGDSFPTTALTYEFVANIHARIGHRAVADSLRRRALSLIGGFLPPDSPEQRRLRDSLAAHQRQASNSRP